MEPILSTDRDEAGMDTERKRRERRRNKMEMKEVYRQVFPRLVGDSQVTRCRNWQVVLERTLTPSISDRRTQGSYRGSLSQRQRKKP